MIPVSTIIREVKNIILSKSRTLDFDDRLIFATIVCFVYMDLKIIL